MYKPKFNTDFVEKNTSLENYNFKLGKRIEVGLTGSFLCANIWLFYEKKKKKVLLLI